MPNDVKLDCRILLKSEEFGEEKFEYDSIEEANAGFDRLLASSTEASKNDGIHRTLELVIRRAETPPSEKK